MKDSWVSFQPIRKNARGELDFSKASSDGSLSCDVTGTSLGKVAKLRPENAGNDVDPVRPEGTVTVSGDNTSAKAGVKELIFSFQGATEES
jgi:hypothetical protein